MKIQRLIILFGITAILLAACASPTQNPETQPIFLDTPTQMVLNSGSDGTAVLTWSREGGIAGFCDQVMVFANGDFTVETCTSNAPPRRGQLSPDQLAQFTNWVNTLGSFEDGVDDTSTPFPDQMFVKTSFKGSGTTQPRSEDIAAISEFASLLVAETPPTEPTSTDGHPEAAIKARDFLAAELGISSSEITIVSAEAVEWSDSCLGLGGAEEMCAAMITPGYRVILEAQGKEYELHTDESGENIRRVP